ncbi:hypothetical protein FEZ51_06315 [Pediococcus stilesii]|uniref:Uncharacterized protein n=1 Tax=Pediococcus stilesii TaxID=331679 RepID=A0A5R9BW36_9LACO|nr:hypothetical protein [Pediococcus stilesii]TLQ04211.1 hypothetical protein FEZ51_06315 [Pediococcus stilesii]
MKFLKWLWKHLFIIIIATVVTIFMGYLVIRWICYKDTYLYRYLFQDANGKFVWTGLTAIVAIITLAINAWDNRRKFKADLVSKSRIEWMNTVRPYISDYYENFNQYVYEYMLFMNSIPGSAERTERNEALTKRMHKIKKAYYNIKLYVPNSKSNKKLLKNIELTWYELGYIGPYFEYGFDFGKIRRNEQMQQSYSKVVIEYVSSLSKKGIEEASKYFKDEWEHAKNGD